MKNSGGSMPHLLLVEGDEPDEATKKQAFETGANSFIEKPRTFLAFREMLESLVQFWRFNQVPACIRFTATAHGGILRIHGPRCGRYPPPDEPKLSRTTGECLNGIETDWGWPTLN